MVLMLCCIIKDFGSCNLVTLDSHNGSEQEFSKISLCRSKRLISSQKEPSPKTLAWQEH